MGDTRDAQIIKMSTQVWMSKENTPGSTDSSTEGFSVWGEVGLEWKLCGIDLMGRGS